MSIRRLLCTVTVMAAIGVLLHAVTPAPAEVLLALTHPQRLADTAGADAVVLCLAGALAAAVWAWGALGLLLTAAGAVPGAVGAAARLLARAVLPAGARKAAALALGVGIGLGGPLLTGTALAAPPAASAAPDSAPVPDWPVGTVPAAPPASTAPAAPPADTPPPAAPVPDWPAPLPAGTHVVLRGDCLWTIADRWLRTGTAHAPTDAEIATAVRAWWRANEGVIGPDPDLLLPGQVLHAPLQP